jgi:hypothetical protein
MTTGRGADSNGCQMQLSPRRRGGIIKTGTATAGWGMRSQRLYSEGESNNQHERLEVQLRQLIVHPHGGTVNP